MISVSETLVIPTVIAPITAPPTPSVVKELKSSKLKDPNAPKKPLTSFFLFCQEHRARLRAENTELSMTELNKVMAGLWEKAVKTPYEQEAQRRNEKYREELKDYLKNKDLQQDIPLESIIVSTVPAAEPATMEEPKAKKSKKERKEKKEKKEKEEKVSTDAISSIGSVPLIIIPQIPAPHNDIFAPSTLNREDQSPQTEKSSKKKSKSPKKE